MMFAMTMTSQALAATFSMATKWSSNTMTVGDVTVAFDSTSTPQTGYVKMVKGGTLTITSTNTVRRITINYVAGYVPSSASAITVDNSASCVFTPIATTTSTSWWGGKASVKITDDATNGNDLRISSIVVTTNNDMQIYKVSQSVTNPSGITHTNNSTNNSTSVGITYGTGFGNNSSDIDVYPNVVPTTKNAAVYNAMGYWWETNSQTWPNVTIGSENIIPRTGAYYVLNPTVSGEITVYMCHFKETTIYVLENGKMYKKYTAPDSNNNTRTWYTFKVRAGYRYYIYSMATKGWTSPLYGFEFISESARNNQYMVADGETFYNHKTIRSVGDITMTFGGWLSEANARQADIISNNSSAYGTYTDLWVAGKTTDYTAINGFQYYTEGNGNNPLNEANLAYDTKRDYYMNPCRGTYYKFEPRRTGWVNVYVLQNAGKTTFFTDENGTAQAATYISDNTLTKGTDNGYTAASKGFYQYTFMVYAGQTYFLFAPKSKLGFGGFEFNLDSTSVLGSLTMNYGDGTAHFNSYANVTFNRTLTKNRWNSLVLPFSMNEAQVRETFGEGTMIMQFDDVANNTIKFKRHYYQYIVAGQPCLIFPTAGWDAVADSSDHTTVSTFTMRQVSVRSDNAGLKEYTSTTIPGYTMKGLYAASTTVPGVSYWLVANNTIGRRTTSYTVNGNFMAYIQGPSAPLGVKELTVGFARFDEDLDSETTGIVDVQNRQSRSTGNVYNLQGVLVKANAVDFEGLPAGIYIVNGKKYSIK